MVIGVKPRTWHRERLLISRRSMAATLGASQRTVSHVGRLAALPTYLLPAMSVTAPITPPEAPASMIDCSILRHSCSRLEPASDDPGDSGRGLICGPTVTSCPLQPVELTKRRGFFAGARWRRAGRAPSCPAGGVVVLGEHARVLIHIAEQPLLRVRQHDLVLHHCGFEERDDRLAQRGHVLR